MDLDVGPGASEVELVLPRPAVVGGRVVVNDGSAAEDVTVKAVWREGTRSFESVSARTAPDGSFTLEGVHPGAYTLVIDRGAGMLIARTNVSVSAGEVVDDVELHATRGGFIDVLVVDVNGVGVPDRLVEAQAVNAALDPAHARPWARTDSGGTVRLGPLLPGETTVSVVELGPLAVPRVCDSASVRVRAGECVRAQLSNGPK